MLLTITLRSTLLSFSLSTHLLNCWHPLHLGISPHGQLEPNGVLRPQVAVALAKWLLLVAEWTMLFPRSGFAVHAVISNPQLAAIYPPLHHLRPPPGVSVSGLQQPARVNI